MKRSNRLWRGQWNGIASTEPSWCIRILKKGTSTKLYSSFFVSVLIFLGILLFFLGCNKIDDNDIISPSNPPPQQTMDSIKVNDTVILKSNITLYIITNGGEQSAKLIDDSTVTLPTLNALRNFSDSQMIVTKVKEGDYLVSDQNTNLPYGLLAKVQSAINDGTKWTLRFSKAGLDEIFDRLDFDWHFNLPDITENIYEEISIPLSGSQTNKLSIEGSLFLIIKSRLAFKIQDAKVAKANFTSTATSNTIINLFLQHQGNLPPINDEIYSKDYPQLKKRITFKIKGKKYEFPLGLTVAVRVGLKVDGSGKLLLSGQLVDHLENTNLYLGYDGQEWKAEGKSEGQDKPTQKQFKLKGKFKAGIASDVTFQFSYPFVKTSSKFGLEVYGRLEGKCEEENLSIAGFVGTNAYLQGTISLLSHNVYNPNLAIIPLIEKQLFKNNLGPDMSFCETEPPVVYAGSHGDVHIFTFDKKRYDYQAKGEFLALVSRYNNLMVQVRQGDIPEVSSRLVTFNKAFAIRSGNDYISFQVQPFKFYVNRELKDLHSTIPLSGSGSIKHTGNKIFIQFDNGDKVLIMYYPSGYLDYKVSLIEEHKGMVSGLLGNWNGNSYDDVQSKAGVIINPNNFSDLYHHFNDWRVQSDSSLFVYDPGTSTEFYTDLSYPAQPFVPNTQQYESAYTDCYNAGTRQPFLSNCITDVVATGSTKFIESSREAQNEFDSDDLVAYYPMDGGEPGKDASNYGNHGMVTGNLTPTTDRQGNADGALSFGNGNYITVPNSPSIMGLTREATLSAWVLFKGWERNGWAGIICKSEGETNRTQLTLRKGGIYSDGEGVGINPPFSLDQWYHVVVVIRGNKRFYYLNGEKIGETTSGVIKANLSPLSIGRDAYGVTEYHIGSLDEIRLYSRALGDDEIKALAK